MNPNDCSRRILLCVTGMSPQVVTETLYALVTEQQFIPTEIHVITTVQGSNRLVYELLDPRNGHFHAFCREYGLEGRIRFKESCVKVIQDGKGVPLPDIRTPEENALAADFITTVVRDLCADESAALHVSIAGGRKSMGFYLGYALSLFARPQDRLSHVLVSEPFESQRDFFFPYRTPRQFVEPTNGRILNDAEARIMLADIPLVRLRSGLPNELLVGQSSYSDTVKAAQAGLDFVELAFDVKNRTVYCGSQAIRLQPILLAFYLWMARMRLAGQTVRPDEASRVAFLEVYYSVVGMASGDYENTKKSLKDEIEFTGFFNEKKARLHAALRKHLAMHASLYTIHGEGKKSATRYGLKIPADKIRL